MVWSSSDLWPSPPSKSYQPTSIIEFNGVFFATCAAANLRLASSTLHDVHWFGKWPFRNIDLNLQDVAILKPEMTIFGEEGGAVGGVRGGHNVSVLCCMSGMSIKYSLSSYKGLISKDYGNNFRWNTRSYWWNVAVDTVIGCGFSLSECFVIQIEEVAVAPPAEMTGITSKITSVLVSVFVFGGLSYIRQQLSCVKHVFDVFVVSLYRLELIIDLLPHHL